MGMSFIDQVDKKGTECCVHSVRDGNGTLIRYEVETGEDKEHFADLTNEEKTKVLAWLRYNLIPAANVLEGHSSYGMKHILERRTGIYMTNNMFKEAALVCGFLPAVVDELNWRFRVRKTSPMFMRQTDGETGLPMMGERMDYSKSAGLKVINLDE